MSVINTNITSMIGQQNLNASKSALTTSMERLSSGLRINSAKDDAAGQAIANRMSAQITGLSTAQRNANDGISVAQTAEGALNQINDNLQRVRELAVQAENGTNSEKDLTSIQDEINQRLEEIDRISGQTDFNGTKVLTEDNKLSIQVGANDGEAITVNLEEINAKTLGLEGFNVNGKGEVANEAATLDDLTLAGAKQTSGTNEYVLSTDNTAATAVDVLSATTEAGSNITVGDATFTVNADGNFEQTQTFSDGSAVSEITAAMTPSAAGETVAAEVTIGGESTNVSIASDGSITNADSGNTLYLDSTGNLTENNAGGPPAATIDNLSQSLTETASSSIEFGDGTKYATGSVNGSNAITTGSGAVGAASDFAAAVTGAAGTGATTGAQLDIIVDGNSTTVYADSSGGLFTDPGFGAGNEFTLDGSVTQATASDLGNKIASGDATATLMALGDGTGAAGNVGDTYTVNRDVALSGKEVSSADISDELKDASDATYTLTQNIEGSDGTNDTQTIDFVVSGGAITGVTANTYTDNGGTDPGLNDGDAVYVAADDSGLTTATTTDVSYFAQENGNITNDAGQRIYQNAEGAFTTDDVTVGDRTEDPLATLDSALNQVDSLRSELGAVQNRFESAITNLSTNETNLSAARSRIEDADYAVEVANMTRAQILQQAGTSVLAQANQVPQSVLSLLG
ncbi:flagellin [Halomonas sp. DN3]|uniref:flagellin N-terminal helical domain-containing protein n=1 Tax=Halomonas sp. DN3 TaxID=2953657 RepID=UPI00263F952A|nr:flagellin [Halomonas sp. DN3]